MANPNGNPQNLTIPKPGEVRNPRGKPKGTKDLATIVRKVMMSKIDWDKINIRDTTGLQKRFGKGKVAEALVWVAASKALTGDMQAFNALREAGYGRIVNFDGEAKIDVVHILKPEKLDAAQIESAAEQLRQRALAAVEGEIVELDSPTGTADVRTIDP